MRCVPVPCCLPSPGCIARLSVSGVLYSLQSDAVERSDVRQCEVCRSESSCRNDALCQEALNERGHRCICAPGFTGETCDQRGEVCYPGETPLHQGALPVARRE